MATHPDTLQLYRLLVDHISRGCASIDDELLKPKAEADVHFMLGATELNAALAHALFALEASGIIDDDDLVCSGCGEPLTDHPDDHGLPAKKSPRNKAN